MMKYILATAIAIVLVPSANAGQLFCQTFGELQHCSGPGGYQSSQSTFGNMTRGNDNRGNQWTTSRFGDQSNTSIFNNRRQ